MSEIGELLQSLRERPEMSYAIKNGDALVHVHGGIPITVEERDLLIETAARADRLADALANLIHDCEAYGARTGYLSIAKDALAGLGVLTQTESE